MSNRVFSFSGEFVRRAEFIPIENLIEIKGRLASFDLIDMQKGVKEYNFRPFSLSLNVKNISFQDISVSVQNFLQPYDKVTSEISQEENESEMFAFGDEHLALWGGKESSVSNKVIWLELVKLRNTIQTDTTKTNNQLLNNLSRAISLIGSKNNLLLVDLDARKIFDCSDTKEISAYFHSW